MESLRQHLHVTSNGRAHCKFSLASAFHSLRIESFTDLCLVYGHKYTLLPLIQKTNLRSASHFYRENLYMKLHGNWNGKRSFKSNILLYNILETICIGTNVQFPNKGLSGWPHRHYTLTSIPLQYFIQNVCVALFSTYCTELIVGIMEMESKLLMHNVGVDSEPWKDQVWT